MEKLQDEHRVAMEALKRHYARLAADEAARVQAAKSSAEQTALRERWKAYGCRIKSAFTDCNHVYTVTFRP